MTELDHSRIDASRLLEVTKALGAERDLDRLLDVILDAAKDMLQADRCSLFLRDEHSGDLWTRIAQGSKTIRLQRGSGIAGSVAESAELVNIPDAYQDQRFNQANDVKSGYRTRSILAIPLVDHAHRVVGVLQALNRNDGSPFDDHDESLAVALCAQAAVAISTAQLIQSEMDHQRVVRDLELAHTIQQSLLPQDVPEIEGWKIAQWQAPCDETGGDYHDYLIGDGFWDLVVGDVSGHGVAAALMMSTARASLRSMHRHCPAPNILLQELNEILEHDMAADQFMTMTICRLYPHGGCDFGAAGHEPPLIYRPSSGTFDELDSTGFMLGAVDDADYDLATTQPLVPGDILVSCTDGIFEAANNEDVEWGYPALKQAVAKHAAGGARAVCDAVIDGVRMHLGGKDVQDDISLVVVERQ